MQRREGLIVSWLALTGFLVVAMITVGGATRLTDSGLSITEWQLITGFVPPLNMAEWAEAFEKYRQIPEYKLINKGMSLAEFKVIYWWEWGHRFLGRVIGFVVIIPLLGFWFAGWLAAWLKRRVVIIFLAGAAQGGLGWYMVMSGLVERTDVSQYRLAAHLLLAFIILGLIVWSVLDLVRAKSDPSAARAMALSARISAGTLVALIFAQIFMGALVAGLDAGQGYNTWPLMDGALVPDGLFAASPWYLNLFENAMTVQFNHRMAAYLLVAAICVHVAIVAPRAGGTVLATGVAMLSTALAQTGLGIWTLLRQAPLDLSLIHQGGAVVLLVIALWHVHALRRA